MKKIDNTLHTKYGTAKIDNNGYYHITSSKEGNHNKFLHRLIFEDYHNCKLDENDVIHHIDFDKTNNHPSNLICMSKKAHTLIHRRSISHSERTKKRISESLTDRNLSYEHKNNISKTKNTTGYLNVYKKKCKKCNQGFRWCYEYTKNSKRKTISSVSLEKLEAKVKAQGLTWMKIEEEMN